MRQGSISGAIFLWVFVAIIASIAEERSALNVLNATDKTQLTTLYILIHPDWTNMATLGLYLGAILNVITLWFNGTLWEGYWIWAYVLVIFSIFAGIGYELLLAVATGLGALLGLIGRVIASLNPFGR